MTNIDSVGATAPTPPPKPKVAITVEFVTPGQDPVNSPDSAMGNHTQNHFTYSAANPGVLRVELRAKVSPTGNTDEAMKRVRFKVDKIPGSKLEWEGNKGGKPTRSIGDFVETSVTFTKLPKKNDHFGKKKAKLYLDGGLIGEREYMVFFPRDARNHPGKPTNAPNWFFYWKQVARAKGGVTQLMQYGGAMGGGTMAVVPGMRHWNYNAYRPKRTMVIYNGIVNKTRAYGIGIELSGIDCFIGNAIHETKHIDQIQKADALVPHIRCWRFGYSWNQTPSNHWRSGRPDGLWGNPPIATAAVNVKPPFQIGQGADVYIDNAACPMWPAVWTLPAVVHIHPIEQEAINHSDSSMVADNKFARDDWADPGKNHQTRDDWTD
jgi:hypothetical protein